MSRLAKDRLDKLREKFCGQITLDFHTKDLINEVDELIKERDALSADLVRLRA